MRNFIDLIETTGTPPIATPPEVSIQFREHRGSFEESMATLKKFNSINEVLRYAASIVRPYDPHVSLSDITITPYSSVPDVRAGWDNTFVVNCSFGNTQGVIGFTNRGS